MIASDFISFSFSDTSTTTRQCAVHHNRCSNNNLKTIIHFGLQVSFLFLLNNCGFLAWYTFMTFAFLVTPGYMTYKRRTFNLEGKINAQWSRYLFLLWNLMV